MPVVTALIAFSDSSCHDPIRIDYSFPKFTDCNPATVTSACVKSGENGWYFKTSCVTDISTFGDEYWHNHTSQYQSLNAGQDCAADPTEGVQYPLSQCTPIRHGNATYYEKAVVDPGSGQLYWLRYPDEGCLAATSKVEIYGSEPLKTAACIASFNKVSVLNYNGYKEQIIYSGSDCKTPIMFASDIAQTECVATGSTASAGGHKRSGAESSVTAECSWNADLGVYESVTCSSKNRFDDITQSAFAMTSTVVTVQSYEDTICNIPKSSQAYAVGACYHWNSTTNGISYGSANLLISPDGLSVALNYFSDASCKTQVLSNSFPTNGACTLFGKVLAVIKNTPKVKSNPPNFGAVFGGGLGGLILVTILVLFAFHVRAKKSRAREMAHTGGDVTRTGTGSQLQEVSTGIEPKIRPHGFLVAGKKESASNIA
ncbi:hypothetical protein BCR33DRAFT_718443 [Rhizoclosmatium globosum]|uniref:Uncharacterized protein n=1 Tax=Rhizoclosmatium globosum TaxID=329046 RepID=A0A1Y2C5D8_9FUNG|nr:hypothetical protein BCR33DRAFT_718443 [Rhizoclosmatium globosum]|eukprot:ORY42253.1 hypothetical protein BCR33DRAFT_718443 [Rhizoclosmatium globosum]